MVSSKAQVEKVLAFPDARRLVEEEARRAPHTPAKLMPLLSARGLVLAEDVVADRDFPPFARATRDGYALRSSDLAVLPAKLKVVGSIRAGGSPPRPATLRQGEAFEIMTGAPVPRDADAIIMLEDTSRDGDWLEVRKPAVPGQNIVATGAEADRGEKVLAAGTRLGYAQIAVAAAVGKAQVRAHCRPRVAVLCTGDELVDVASAPAENQIRNCNSYSLAAQVLAAGGDPLQLPIAPDQMEPLRHSIQQGLAAELLLISGGVSMGKYDLVEQVLTEFGAEFLFTGALIQPGRPVVFGSARRPKGAGATYFFGLPGNPVSTMVTFELFARAMIEGLSGATASPLAFPKAKLKREVKTKTGLTRFLPATLFDVHGEAEIEPVPWKGSGDIVSLARANCFLVVPPDRNQLAMGELVSVLLM